jgi:hypothetical protein
MIYELRTYEAAPGKLGALNARFRDVTLAYFEQYGIEVVGFWTYAHGGWSDHLVYMLAFEDMADKDAKWAAFGADEGRREAFAESEKDGALVSRIRSDIMRPTNYSPLR